MADTEGMLDVLPKTVISDLYTGIELFQASAAVQ